MNFFSLDFSEPFGQLGLMIVGGCGFVSFLLFAQSHHRQRFFSVAPLSFFSLTICGLALIVASSEFATVMVGVCLKVLGVCGTALSLSKRKSILEGVYKYLLAALLGFGMMIVGLALFYSNLGIERFNYLGEYLSFPAETSSPLLNMALVFVLVGFASFLALMPCHFWSVGFFESLPTPLVVLLDSGVKTGFILLFIRTFSGGYGDFSPTVFSTLTFFGVLSVVGGGVLSLVQNNIKKVFAYISIVYFGILCLGLSSLDGASDFGINAIINMAISYCFVSTLSLAIVSSFEREGLENIGLQDLVGIGSRRPVGSTFLCFSFLGLAGFPLTAGFWPRAGLFQALIQKSQMGLVLIVCFGTLLTLYPMAKIVGAMFLQNRTSFQSATPIDSLPGRFGGKIFLVCALAFVALNSYFGTVGVNSFEDFSKKYTIGLIKK